MNKNIKKIKGMQRIPNYRDLLFCLDYMVGGNPTKEEVDLIKGLISRAAIKDPGFKDMHKTIPLSF